MRTLNRVLIVLLVLGLGVWLAFSVSVWPGAMLVRALFKRGGERMRAELAPAERADVRAMADVAYRPGDADARMDVYLPERVVGTAARLPVIVWTHGGGWVGGDKSEMRGYLMLLASRGYVVVALNYGLAPEHRYPRALHQINAALACLEAQAERFNADVQRVFMGGDSAGAQLTAQFAVLVTDPAHAQALDLVPALRPEQLRGLILHCGLYDMATYVERADGAGGAIGYAALILPWAYLGERRPPVEALRAISPLHQVSAAYPPVFISGGNADPLTAHQSRPMAARLSEVGVEVTALFFADDHQPALPHEYQFTLSTAAARTALVQTLRFLAEHGRPAHEGGIGMEADARP